jgi:hypothetical protein
MKSQKKQEQQESGTAAVAEVLAPCRTMSAVLSVAKEQAHSVDQILEAHRLVKQSAGATVAYAIWIGRELQKIVKTLQAGWMIGEFIDKHIATRGLSRATAYRYMQMTKRLSPEQVKALPETLEGVQACIAKLALPAGRLTAIYKEFGMVAEPVKKPAASSVKVADAVAEMTFMGCLSSLTKVEQWVKAHRQTISANDRDTIRKSIAFLQSLLDAPVEAVLK